MVGCLIWVNSQIVLQDSNCYLFWVEYVGEKITHSFHSIQCEVLPIVAIVSSEPIFISNCLCHVYNACCGFSLHFSNTFVLNHFMSYCCEHCLLHSFQFLVQISVCFIVIISSAHGSSVSSCVCNGKSV